MSSSKPPPNRAGTPRTASYALSVAEGACANRIRRGANAGPNIVRERSTTSPSGSSASEGRPPGAA
ncbi:hypothetical protein WMF04_34235 [Sorangium sp. So ce260]